MGVVNQLVVLVICFFQISRSLPNRTSKTLMLNTIDTDYNYYEYELSNNSVNHDAAILPNPELFADFNDLPEEEDEAEPMPNIPDNSLADSDLHDHDFIDNIMYIYYGTHTKNGYTYGAEIVLIGSILSCAAQFLTIICVLLRKKYQKSNTFVYLFHFVFCLCLTNLVFMFGVYATKYKERCRFIAVLLHYMHLLVSVWIFTHTYIVWRKFRNEYVPKVKIVLVFTYGIPAFLVLLYYATFPKSYESGKFCWISVEKGMFINFVIPVTSLIIGTTLVALNGISKINLELSKFELSSTDSIDYFDNQKQLISLTYHIDVGEFSYIRNDNTEDLSHLHGTKKCFKNLSIMQTSYVVVWFVTVLALENAPYSSVMPFSYAVSSIILNWYILMKSSYLAPNFKDYDNPCEVLSDMAEITKSIDDVTSSSGLTQCGDTISDNVPLLNGTDNYTELIELRLESISTISS